MKGIIKIGIYSIIMLVVALIGSFECQAATPDSVVYSLYFRQGDDLLMKDYRGNEHSLNGMIKVMTSGDTARITTIKIIGATSPEGGLEFNNELAQKRAEAVRSYIIWQLGLSDQRVFRITGHADSLFAWIRAVESDTDVPRREKVLEILYSDASIETKWANIQRLTGHASQYMEQQIFPSLRNAVACVVTFNNMESASSHTADSTLTRLDTTTPDSAIAATTSATAPIANSDTATVTGAQTSTNNNTKVTSPKISKPNKPLFALKTNLLFDAATILNLEVEVPIGKRWSVAGELIFPWWLWENKQNCIQMLSGIIEGRYWFGNRINRPVMTGWFAGVHVGGGYYDLELNRKGYQGEFFLAAGVSGGYAHTINKKGNLRMEYSLGVGYLSTNYRSYEAKFSDVDNSWHLYHQESGQFSWFGPTRAKVSLVWMLDTNLFKKRGGRR